MLEKQRATSVGQVDPFAIAAAMESKVRSMDLRALVSTLLGARVRLAAFYRGEIVRLALGSTQEDPAGLDADAFAGALRAMADREALAAALVTFLRGNMRVIDIIGGSFAQTILRDAEDGRGAPAVATTLAVEDEGSISTWGSGFRVAALCAAILVTGALVSIGTRYATSSVGVRQNVAASTAIRTTHQRAVAPRVRHVPHASFVAKAVAHPISRAPFTQRIGFSAKPAPFRQMIFSTRGKRGRL